MAKRSSSKRELIDTGRNKMFAKRTPKGRFKESDDVSRSLSRDRRTAAKRTVKAGFWGSGRPEAHAKGREEEVATHPYSATYTEHTASWLLGIIVRRGSGRLR